MLLVSIILIVCGWLLFMLAYGCGVTRRMAIELQRWRVVSASTFLRGAATLLAVLAWLWALIIAVIR